MVSILHIKQNVVCNETLLVGSYLQVMLCWPSANEKGGKSALNDNVSYPGLLENIVVQYGMFYQTN